jgi:hypothetical protein
MEAFVAIAIVMFVCYWAYRSGKHEGSRKGFAVGRYRR